MSTHVQSNLSKPNAEFSSHPPMSVKDWMITILILAIPVVNLIMMFVWAFGGGANPSKANYCKAALIWAAIGLVIYGIIMVLTLVVFASATSSLSY
ncbi:hypothetical protein [Paenibacillus massiliensis]|uniref:hypothetical protein n=2 Tax=Paenibacillus TaxID=44249 RepID=UPI000A07813F|nr:hypothetical protein [Paenibacillus massiliensis]